MVCIVCALHEPITLRGGAGRSLCGAGQAGHFLGKDDSTLAIYINYLSML